MIKQCHTALLLCALSFTAAAQSLYDPQAEMQEEMGAIAKKISLGKQQMYEVANILNERVLLKQATMNQIIELFHSLEKYDQSADKQIRALLDGNQREVWDKELIIQLWEARKERSEMHQSIEGE